MYRKSNGKLGLRSLSLFGDLPGSVLSSSSGADPGHISLRQQDAIYLYQLQSTTAATSQNEHPWLLTPETLQISQIIDVPSISHKVFEKLQTKLHLLTATGEVDTSGFDNPNFGKEYMNQLSMIPVSRQKHLVDFLFWWDDETRRLRKLMDEREELMVLINAASGDVGEQEKVKGFLDRVNRKIGMKPSERVGEMERDEDLFVDGTSTGHGGAVNDEDLPAYQRN